MRLEGLGAVGGGKAVHAENGAVIYACSTDRMPDQQVRLQKYSWALKAGSEEQGGLCKQLCQDASHKYHKRAALTVAVAQGGGG